MIKPSQTSNFSGDGWRPTEFGVCRIAGDELNRNQTCQSNLGKGGCCNFRQVPSERSGCGHFYFLQLASVMPLQNLLVLKARTRPGTRPTCGLAALRQRAGFKLLSIQGNNLPSRPGMFQGRQREDYGSVNRAKARIASVLFRGGKPPTDSRISDHDPFQDTGLGRPCCAGKSSGPE